MSLPTLPKKTKKPACYGDYWSFHKWCMECEYGAACYAKTKKGAANHA